jgi:hypothetical protein
LSYQFNVRAPNGCGVFKDVNALSRPPERIRVASAKPENIDLHALLTRRRFNFGL